MDNPWHILSYSNIRIVWIGHVLKAPVSPLTSRWCRSFHSRYVYLSGHWAWRDFCLWKIHRGNLLMFLYIFGEYKCYRQNYLDSVILPCIKIFLDYMPWPSFISVSEVQKAWNSILQKNSEQNPPQFTFVIFQYSLYIYTVNFID